MIRPNEFVGHFLSADRNVPLMARICLTVLEPDDLRSVDISELRDLAPINLAITLAFLEDLRWQNPDFACGETVGQIADGANPRDLVV